jgi:hypothetical protein
MEFHLHYNLIFRLIVKLELNEFQLNEDGGATSLVFASRKLCGGLSYELRNKLMIMQDIL